MGLAELDLRDVVVILVALPLIYRLVVPIYVHFIWVILWKKKDLVKVYGKWAVVTGGSRGIGKGYSIELAKRGMNIVLISHGLENLRKAAKEIAETGVETKIICADFSRTEKEYKKIFSVIDDLDIGILVNNVGTAEGFPNYFEEMPRDKMWAIMMINMCAAASMTHFVLHKMIRKRRGMIVNMVSLTTLGATPFASIYGASKAFMRSFTEALIFECKGTGVEFQIVCPGFVDTDIVESNARSYLPSVFFPKPENFAKSATATIGKVVTTTGCFAHDLQFTTGEYLPRSWRAWICSKFINVKDRKCKK
ncbi:hydroxysteroid dehydrogenase-like protein 1 [Neocloeon triangulifer]|uniref:hydroxysteroid dehydrogenase-like protein 1 n=1 Tax=Neocloeon triangulifer TaxID=2078957 RepID=UPI00286F6A95|nr:hydroxysteroid dehydrogenase-like protein 1 [Neocloeon triangulifer]